MVAKPPCRRQRGSNGDCSFAWYRSACWIGSLADTAAAHVSGHHWLVAPFLCSQSLHPCHGQAENRSASNPFGALAERFRTVRRSSTAGAGTDRNRHQLCDHGAFSRRPTRFARFDGHGSCGWTGAWCVSPIVDLIVLPI